MPTTDHAHAEPGDSGDAFGSQPQQHRPKSSKSREIGHKNLNQVQKRRYPAGRCLLRQNIIKMLLARHAHFRPTQPAGRRPKVHSFLNQLGCSRPLRNVALLWKLSEDRNRAHDTPYGKFGTNPIVDLATRTQRSASQAAHTLTCEYSWACKPALQAAACGAADMEPLLARPHLVGHSGRKCAIGEAVERWDQLQGLAALR
jgi:hypothetical protein